jgi:Icc-related predicted phosphoesterase
VTVTRILAVADELEEALYGEKLYEIRPDLIVSCGDLPFEYLENLVSRANVPLVYVPGNHDPDLDPDFVFGTMMTTPLPGPQGCDNADGRILSTAGLRVGGLGGSLRYNLGPNQYTQVEMRVRSLNLEVRSRIKRLFSGRGLDLLLTHAAPLGCGDLEDPPHLGFAAYHRLVKKLAPRFLIHGHVHPVSRAQRDHRIGDTLVVNAVPYRLLEI